MLNAQSNDSLRELNAKLLTEIVELRKKFAEIKVENDELKDKNAETVAFSDKIAELEAERTELKARIAGLLRQSVEESKWRDAENARLKARIEELEKGRTDTVAENARRDDAIAELKAEVVKLRDDNEEIKQQTQDISPEEIVNVPSSVVVHETRFTKLEYDVPLIKEEIQGSLTSTSPIPTKTISLEGKEIDEFLDSVYKERVSKEIIQRIREKKLRDLEPPSTPENNTPNISREQGLIQEITSSIKEQAQSTIPPEIKNTIKISANNDHPKCDNSRITRDSETQDIICLYQNACDAEKDAIEANRKEILCWCFYAEDVGVKTQETSISSSTSSIQSLYTSNSEDAVNEDVESLVK